jgi:hypothetical protein
MAAKTAAASRGLAGELACLAWGAERPPLCAMRCRG